MFCYCKYLCDEIVTCCQQGKKGSRGLVPLQEGSEGRAEPLPFFLIGERLRHRIFYSKNVFDIQRR